MVTHQSYLNMVPDESNTPVIHVSQYDSNFTIEFFLIAVKGEFVPKYPTAVTDNVTFSVESGTTVEVRGTKKDGNGYSASASLSGKKVTVTGHEQMTAIAGKNTFEVVLKYNNKEISTANFILDVERAALDKDTVRSASVIREIIDTIDRTDEFLGAAHSISQDKADVAEMLEDAEDARDAAQAAQTAAAVSATNASGSASSASTSANTAKSWAVGPNGSGDGTDTNNAKYYSQQADASASLATQNATNASTSASAARSWAVGPNGSGSGTSTNNSKYYSEQATTQAMRSKNWAVGPSGSGNGTDTNNSKYYAEQAASSASSADASASTAETKASEAEQSANLGQGYATEAQGAEQRASVNASNAETSATAADTSALKSEGYAIGKQNGSDVDSTSPYYHNNAKYYAEQAAASAEAAGSEITEIREAKTAAQIAASNASSSASSASQSASSASDAAIAAAGYASSASTSANTAKSWAVGPNGSGPGTDTNNSKYYAEQAAASQAAVEGILDTVLGNFATVESSTTASKAYKIGEYLVLNNLLYRVTAAIASGGTITVGTNVVQTTVGDEIANNVLCCSDPNNDGNIVITLGGSS